MFIKWISKKVSKNQSRWLADIALMHYIFQIFEKNSDCHFWRFESQLRHRCMRSLSKNINIFDKILKCCPINNKNNWRHFATHSMDLVKKKTRKRWIHNGTKCPKTFIHRQMVFLLVSAVCWAIVCVDVSCIHWHFPFIWIAHKSHWNKTGGETDRHTRHNAFSSLLSKWCSKNIFTRRPILIQLITHWFYKTINLNKKNSWSRQNVSFTLQISLCHLLAARTTQILFCHAFLR